MACKVYIFFYRGCGHSTKVVEHDFQHLRHETWKQGLVLHSALPPTDKTSDSGSCAKKKKKECKIILEVKFKDTVCPYFNECRTSFVQNTPAQILGLTRAWEDVQADYQKQVQEELRKSRMTAFLREYDQDYNSAPSQHKPITERTFIFHPDDQDSNFLSIPAQLDERDCVICQYSLTQHRHFWPVTQLPCGHVFHLCCIRGWLLKRDDCADPNCKTTVRKGKATWTLIRPDWNNLLSFEQMKKVTWRGYLSSLLPSTR